MVPLLFGLHDISWRSPFVGDMVPYFLFLLRGIHSIGGSIIMYKQRHVAVLLWSMDTLNFSDA
jgi:hypothetical protein